VLIEGRTQVDEAMLTGESLPVARAVGDAVAAGCLNLGAPVVVRVTQLGAQTRYQRIVALVERALTERPTFLVSADRIAGPFLWAVLLLAGGAYLAWHVIDPGRALWVAVSVLIVTCPCALSLGAPVAWLAAAGELARRGMLVQRLDALEALTRVRDLVFDKTGTLTEDRLRVAAVQTLSDGGSVDTLLPLAASLGAQSHHPLAQAVAQHLSLSGADGAARAERRAMTDVTEQAGAGLEGRTAGDGVRWRLGHAAWCGVEPLSDAAPTRPAVWLAQWVEGGRGAVQGADPLDGVEGVDGAQALGAVPGRWQPQLRIEFDEQLRADAVQGLADLRAAGLRLHLLSGDQPASVAQMARRLGIDHHRAACSPQDKLAAVETLQHRGARVAMVGDGINDAPVLARADVSIAMGTAAALAQARADVIMLSDRIADLAVLHATARRTRRIVRQNLGWAVAYNAACVPLALLGWLPPWLAGLGMAGSSLLVVLNALRLARPGAGAPAAADAVTSSTAPTDTATGARTDAVRERHQPA
jgi:Cu2+-exporting ATPase